MESWMNWMNAIPFAILGASLLGSGHCVAMCGGLICVVAQNRKAILFYHLGRLIGYSSLGALAGLLGAKALQSPSFSALSLISTLALAFAFVFLGFQLWSGRTPHLFRLPQSFWQKATDLGPTSTGLLSAFLPCGWLHSFILGATATRSPAWGATYLLFFWLGTLPALTASPFLVSRFFRPFSKRAPRISAVILIAIGIGSLGIKMLSAAHPNHSCHHCHESSTMDE